MHELIRDAASRFLRGETSVIDFTYAFQNATNAVIVDRPLEGNEVHIFYALEEWEASGWSGRPAIVDQLRALVSSALNAGEDDRPT